MTAFSLSEIDARLDYLDTLSQAAREITLPLFHAGPDAVNKADQGYDPVTQADIDAEKVLRKLILKTFPEDSIEGEELPDYTGSNDFSWTLDPIDGTRGFVAGVPVWSTLIALSHKDIPIIGMIDLPALDQRYIGRTDGATSKAWVELKDGVKQDLKTKPCARINDAIMGCTEPLAMLNAGELAAYNMIRSAARFSRLGLDAFGYGLVAQGRMDIIIEAGMKPCDTRALMPIIEGAGGKLTDWHGGSAVNGGQVIAVGDASLLPELYVYLGRAMRPI